MRITPLDEEDKRAAEAVGRPAWFVVWDVKKEKERQQETEGQGGRGLSEPVE